MNPIRLGFIGVANQGTYNLKAFFKHDDCVVKAVCDVDDGHLAAAKALVDEQYNNHDCKTYHDFRDLNRANDIDAVVITVPDHWHALIAIDAARNGKDIYLEKPFSLFVSEGRKVCQVIVRRLSGIGRRMVCWCMWHSPFFTHA